MTFSENIDYREIEKFENISAQWWDKQGEFQVLHDINPLRLKYVNDRISPKGKHILDIGCGGGIFSEAMAAAGAKVVGIDMGEAPISIARRHMIETGQQIDYRRTSVEELAKTERQQYDIITCMELIEHVPDPQSIVRSIRKLIKSNGDIFFSTINRTWVAYCFAILVAENLFKIVGKGTHQFNKFVKPSELENWAAQEGLMKQDLTGMGYLPFIRKGWLSRNTKVNYFMHFRCML